ncbi:THAP domain-containing protein 3 [Polypterus senegalus]
MPKSCAAYNCTNRYSNTKGKLTFHRFPLSKPHILKEWLDNIGRENFQPNQHMVLCSEHFTPDCFSGFGNRKNLIWNAVPTIFSFTQDNTKKRRSSKRLRCMEEDIQPVVLPIDEVGAKDGLQIPHPEAKPEVVLKCQGEELNQDLHPVSQTQELPESQPFDHSYAIIDVRDMKERLFASLEINEKLHKMVKFKSEVIRRMKLKLNYAHQQLERLEAAHRRAECSGSWREGVRHTIDCPPEKGNIRASGCCALQVHEKPGL